MEANEVAAHALVAKLGAAGIEGRVSGGGVHWRVDVGPVGSRTLVAHCFWYGEAISGLLLGVNPANARSRLQRARVAYEGPEFLVILQDRAAPLGDGRTHDPTEVVACARAWLAGVERDELARNVPFIDEKGRAMRALSARINPELRRDIGGDPPYELWVYGDGRSCQVQAENEAVTCAFLVGQAQVARAAAVDNVPEAVEAWLIARLSLPALATRVPHLDLERHAEMLETDPARWHWLHVRDRIADPNDVLAGLRELIETLAMSPVAKTFFTFSSLYRLCFSASSHYPWIDDGLPVVARFEDGAYLVGETRCDLCHAIHLIETTLAAYPVRPFFGSAPHHELPLLAACFARQGSALRPRLVQKGGWYRLEVADGTGARRCEVSDRSAMFVEDDRLLGATWSTLDDAVRAIRRYCEDGATLEEIATRSGAELIVRHGPTP